MRPNPTPDYKNMLLAMAAAAVIILVWQFFIEAPKRAQLAQWNAAQEQKKQAEETRAKVEAQRGEDPAAKLPREERLKLSPRLRVQSEGLHGSIALKGLRFDDLTLVRYRTAVAPGSPEVRLLSPAGDGEAYFMEIGWLAADASRAPRLPDANTLWKADRDTLTPDAPVHLSWNNGAGLVFTVTLALDKDYMFTLRQGVENRTGQAVSVKPYAYVNRAYADADQHNLILHEGPIGVFTGALTEIPYKDLREEKEQRFDGAQGWLGITDKYWLTALIPAGSFDAKAHYYTNALNQERYQVEYTSAPLEALPDGRAEAETRFFAGAKELDTLDAYAKGERGGAPVPLFDRAVDFGHLYFLTKPLFLLLNYLFTLSGNFGVAILLLTILVKLAMFPLANKGFHAASAMRALQPEMQRLAQEHGKDRLKYQQALLALYKQEKVNPAAGCLPILIQIPVFFALYKVLFVTLEMRHAPFFGWIRDLSAADPSNLFTAFGLVPWNAPTFLHLGVLPILMCASMVIQMKQQPKPADPTQAKVMAYMPYFFLIFFASMPAGLVLYWTWSNVLSILQQALISTRYTRKKADAKTA